jgi:hypothetical protein
MSYSRRRKMPKGMTALAFVLGVAAMVALTASVTSAKKPPTPPPPPSRLQRHRPGTGPGLCHQRRRRCGRPYNNRERQISRRHPGTEFRPQCN